MPFVDLHSTDDFASIYYQTNSQFGNVGGFDPEKPTVLILHPMFFDTQWLDYHWGDPRLYKNFNLIALDMRCSGKTVCRSSPRHDTWVEAADVALCHLKLRLPPCHVLALEPTAVCVALRFAVLFPELCLSLALCNVPSAHEPEWQFGILDETMKRWCFAKDMETFEHGGVEAVNLLCGYDNDPDLYDDAIAYLALRTPKDQRVRVAESFGVYANVSVYFVPLPFGVEFKSPTTLQRTPLRPEELAEIKQAVLILHGEINDMHPIEHAERLGDLLTSAKGGPVVCTIMSGASNMSFNRNTAAMLNSIYSRFILQRVDRARSDLRTADISIKERMQMALFKLADIMERTDMGSKDPLSPMSFSCLSEVSIQKQTELLAEYTEAETPFSPLGPDGRPLRKYSDREGRHWFEGGPGGLSIADVASLPPQTRPKPEKEVKTGRRNTLQNLDLSLSLPSSASVSTELIKTSLAKIVANPTTVLGRAMVSA
ncbi:hypothetical protein NP233_g6666 [Leucocoprinus birnbaumii]|uniref:Alpha/beta-hydrolase n=1 Tax=Leucocoprinus birnbaumii TaxID=56174 RepID=A0AAD5VRP4_9AGAR|nr:hypothetical protein NP233_g6666 [Leucocoprinus birnbaumii]